VVDAAVDLPDQTSIGIEQQAFRAGALHQSHDVAVGRDGRRVQARPVAAVPADRRRSVQRVVGPAGRDVEELAPTQASARAPLACSSTRPVSCTHASCWRSSRLFGREAARTSRCREQVTSRRRPPRLPPASEVPHECPPRRAPTSRLPLHRGRPSPEFAPSGVQRGQHRLGPVVQNADPRDLDLGGPDADRLGEQLAPPPPPLDRLRTRSRRRRALPLTPSRQAAVLGVERSDGVEGASHPAGCAAQYYHGASGRGPGAPVRG
jgi:hypothetical protein